jgi:CubicO group peptidase (beta-lactamase class C family)
MKALLMILLSMLVNSACKDFASQVTYNPPIYVEDGLQVGNLEEARMDEDMLLKAAGRIKNGKYGEVHSMLIYKNDQLVFEEYFPGHTYQWDAPGHYGNYVTWNRDMPHCIHSDSKSFDYKRKSIHWYSALGWGGKKISILPESDMVIVFTGANYTSKVHHFKIMNRFILPAVL